jgi:hypothetical protein
MAPAAAEVLRRPRLEINRWTIRSSMPFVMAGLVPAIHALPLGGDMDARDKPGHDGVNYTWKIFT